MTCQSPIIVRGGWFCKRLRVKGEGIEGGEGRGKGERRRGEPWEGVTLGKEKRNFSSRRGKEWWLEQLMKSRRRAGNESIDREDLSAYLYLDIDPFGSVENWNI